jgi:hypothetical protein
VLANEQLLASKPPCFSNEIELLNLELGILSVSVRNEFVPGAEKTPKRLPTATYFQIWKYAMYKPVHVLSRKSTRQHRNVFIWCYALQGGLRFVVLTFNLQVLKPISTGRLAC